MCNKKDRSPCSFRKKLHFYRIVKFTAADVAFLSYKLSFAAYSKQNFGYHNYNGSIETLLPINMLLLISWVLLGVM